MPPNKTTRPEAPEYKSAKYSPELKPRKKPNLLHAGCYGTKRNLEYGGGLTFGVKIMKLLFLRLLSIHSVYVLKQLACSMRMLRMMSRFIILPSRFIILPSQFMPRNSWFVPHACPPHDQLPQPAKSQCLEIQSF